MRKSVLQLQENVGQGPKKGSKDRVSTRDSIGKLSRAETPASGSAESSGSGSSASNHRPRSSSRGQPTPGQASQGQASTGVSSGTLGPSLPSLPGGLAHAFATRATKSFANRMMAATGRTKEVTDKKQDKEESIFSVEFGAQLRGHHRNLLGLAQAFLPAMVTEAAEEDVWAGIRHNMPLLEDHVGTVVRISCGGFHELTERVALHSNGANLLARRLHDYLTPMIDAIVAYRGDVIRFSGAELVVFFEAVNDCGSFHSACGALGCSHDQNELACIRAAACCLELQKLNLSGSLSGMDTEDAKSLTLQIGIGSGTITFIGVRGSPCSYTCNSFEFTVCGRPLENAIEAQHLAAPSEIVVSPEAWKYVQDTAIEGDQLTVSPEYHRLVAFDKRRHTYPMVRHAAQQSLLELQESNKHDPFLDPTEPKVVKRRLGFLMQFLPHTILRHTWAGTSNNVNEMRTVSIAFLYVEGVDPATKEGAPALARVVFSLQQESYAEEGYMLRFVHDGKGLLMQFVYGLPPLVHVDDPVRACCACYRMLRRVSDLNLVGRVGLASGRVFCGLVGSERRHEYALLGEARQLALHLCRQADPKTVVVDPSTRCRCSDQLEFKAMAETQGWKAPIAPFLLISLFEDSKVSPSSPSGKRAVGSSAPSRLYVDTRAATPPPPRKPPWLASPSASSEGVFSASPPPAPAPSGNQPLLPTLWAHVCAERPPPLAPALGQTDQGEPVSPQSNGAPGASSLRAAAVDPDSNSPAAPGVRPWKTHIKVPLPWPVRSTACGGVSPLPRLRSWRPLADAEAAADQATAVGAGMVILAGSYGSGKTELTEHLLTRAVQGPYHMQPIFGAMEQRDGQQWAALLGVLQGALALLEPSGQVGSQDDMRTLLAQEALDEDEFEALGRMGLGAAPVDVPVQAKAKSFGRITTGGTTGSADTRETVGRRISVSSQSSMASQVSMLTSDAPPSIDEAYLGQALANVAVRLVQRLLERGSVVIALRLSQGTSLMPADTTHFWTLAEAFGNLANSLARSAPLSSPAESPRSSPSKGNDPTQLSSLTAGRRSLLVLVTCQHVPVTLRSQHPVVDISPLSFQEFRNYLHLCLGLLQGPDVDSDSDDSAFNMTCATGSKESSRTRESHLGARQTSKSAPDAEPGSPIVGRGAARPDSAPAIGQTQSDGSSSRGGRKVVPTRLVNWLRPITALPRHLEEGLAQLHREGVIAVEDGRCVLLKPLNTLKIVKWSHVHTVGRIISKMEVMVPEMQHVLQVASVISGPFSAVDLAAANRVHLPRHTPKMIIFYHCAKRLNACEDLVRLGFLQRVSAPGTGIDMDAPWWNVTSFLIHKVVGSTLLSGKRMQLRSAVLMSRAISRYKQENRFEKGVSFIGIGPRLKQRQRLQAPYPPGIKESLSATLRPARTGEGDVLKESSFFGCMPSSCVVTPLFEKTTERGRESSVLDTEIDMEQSMSMGNFQRSSRLADMANALESFPKARLFKTKALRQGVIYAVLAVMLLWPDLWVVVGGPPRVQDAVLITAMCVFAVDVFSHVTGDLHYNRYALATDLVVILSVFVDLSFAFGLSGDQLRIQRKNSGAVWRVIMAWVKFGACGGRLSRLMQSLAWFMQKIYGRLGQGRKAQVVPDAGYIPGGASSPHSSPHAQPGGRTRRGALVVPGAGAAPDVNQTGRSSRFLEDISHRLAQAILVNLVMFTILTILSLQVIDVFIPPREDASMEAWANLISQEVANDSFSVPRVETRTERVLDDLRNFYDERQLAYGPYEVEISKSEHCAGNSSTFGFHCDGNMMLRWDRGSFDEPEQKFFRLEKSANDVQTFFDFSQPVRDEARMRIIIIVFTVLCMVLLAVSLDKAIAHLVVSPLARLLPTVRHVLSKMREAFPTLKEEDATEDYDEIEAFEHMVGKITLLVASTKRNQENIEDPAAEYMGASKTQPDAEGVSKASGNQAPAVLKSGETFTPDGSTAARKQRQTNLQESIQQLSTIGLSYEEVNSWNLDVLELKAEQLSGLTAWLLMQPGEDVQLASLVEYVKVVSVEYQNCPYHNWKHAVDVTHGVYRATTLNRTHEYCTSVEIFALHVAAVAHDVGHPGVNNQFLVQTSHELALRYNDLAPLENMHCSTMFMLMGANPEANVFSALSREHYREARKVCIDTILHTDNAQHFVMVKELQMFYAANSDAWDQPGVPFPSMEELELLRQTSTRHLALCVHLHGCDISNPSKPWKICQPWAHLVLGEFFLQGDQEKELGIPVQMLNNRDTVNTNGSQVAFIELFVAPFVAEEVRLFPAMWERSEMLQQNLQTWHANKVAEMTPEARYENDGSHQVQVICEKLQQAKDTAQGRVQCGGAPPLMTEATKSTRSGRASVSSGGDLSVDGLFSESVLREVADGDGSRARANFKTKNRSLTEGFAVRSSDDGEIGSEKPEPHTTDRIQDQHFLSRHRQSVIQMLRPLNPARVSPNHESPSGGDHGRAAGAIREEGASGDQSHPFDVPSVPRMGSKEEQSPPSSPPAVQRPRSSS